MFAKALKIAQTWFAERQEKQFLKSGDGSALINSGMDQSVFLTTLQAPPDTKARMEAMAAEHGLKPGVTSYQCGRSIKMARTCAQCGNRPACSSWLANETTAERPSSFCPNAKDWEALEREYR